MRRGAQVPKIKEGSLVRVRKPFHVKKGLSKFHKPTRVVRRAGANAYVLEDGRTWNASHLSLVPDRAKDIIDSSVPVPVLGPAQMLDVPVPEPGPTQPSGVVQRPARVRKKPAWLNDYVQ